MLVNMFRPRFQKIGILPNFRLEYKYHQQDCEFSRLESRYLFLLLTMTFSVSLLMKVVFED